MLKIISLLKTLSIALLLSFFADPEFLQICMHGSIFALSLTSSPAKSSGIEYPAQPVPVLSQPLFVELMQNEAIRKV